MKSKRKRYRVKKRSSKTKKSRIYKNKESKIDKGFILMIKSELIQYPKIGKHFKVVHGGKSYPLIIKSIPCVRAGSDKPHRHYHLKINFHELKPNDLIEITKDAEKGYLLAIKEILK